MIGDILLVICRYKENLTWLNSINLPYKIYNKGENDINFEYVNVPNYGRESEVFLRYIIENYNNLPKHVIFLQGDPFYHCPDLINLINPIIVNNISEIKALSKFIAIDDEFGYPNHPNLPIRNISNLLGLSDKTETFEFGAGAQYIINRNCILSKSLAWWENAYNVHMLNHLSPWVFERLWPLIFKLKESQIQ